jgi:hypothetical protein
MLHRQVTMMCRARFARGSRALHRHELPEAIRRPRREIETLYLRNSCNLNKKILILFANPDTTTFPALSSRTIVIGAGKYDFFETDVNSACSTEINSI